MPGATGPFPGSSTRSLVNPDRTLYSPRFGVAWSPKSHEEHRRPRRLRRQLQHRAVRTVRGFPVPSRIQQRRPSPWHPAPTSSTTTANATGCTTQSHGVAANSPSLTASAAPPTPIQNNFAVDKNYRLGMVQIYNLDIQRTLPPRRRLSSATTAPRAATSTSSAPPTSTPTGTPPPDAQAFTYEDSAADSHSNALTVSVRKRLQQRRRRSRPPTVQPLHR